MIEARLQGGELDGATDTIEADHPPNLVAAFACAQCGGVHIIPYFARHLLEDLDSDVRMLRYQFIRRDELGALYRYADPSRDPDPGERVPDEQPEPDFEPMPDEREPELMPA